MDDNTNPDAGTGTSGASIIECCGTHYSMSGEEDAPTTSTATTTPLLHHQVPGLKQGPADQVKAQEACNGMKLDKGTARNRSIVGLHVGTHNNDGTADTVQTVDDSDIEHCGNAYFRNNKMIMNATKSASEAMRNNVLPSELVHQQERKRSAPVDHDSVPRSQLIRTKSKYSRKRRRNKKQSQPKPGCMKGVSPDAAW